MSDHGASLPAAKLACPFLTTPQAADFIGLSDRTLERMRTEGLGPDYRKHGRYVRYHIDDLQAWSTSHVMHCTHDV
jgi:predicted DNA-binding transcriptional regulator AlpA